MARAADVAPRRSTLDVMAGRRATVAGNVRPGIAGRHAVLQRRGSKHRWSTIDDATTTAGGAFAFRFRPQRTGSAKLRVAVDSACREIGRLNVYRRAAVSWYGPGLHGNTLSCGGTLTPGTLGVANKTLPCGSHVTLRRGHRVTGLDASPTLLRAAAEADPAASYVQGRAEALPSQMHPSTS